MLNLENISVFAVTVKGRGLSSYHTESLSLKGPIFLIVLPTVVEEFLSSIMLASQAFNERVKCFYSYSVL